MTDVSAGGVLKERKSHVYVRDPREHYVEPYWCDERLFDVEDFIGTVWDPACGTGRIVEVLQRRGMSGFGTDLHSPGDVERSIMSPRDFLQTTDCVPNIVSNPPFNIFKQFALHALQRVERKVALIWLARTLPAARWLDDTPLARIHFLTPRPSMPPASYIAEGRKASGGTLDFCWLVWDMRHKGRPEVLWLRRDIEGKAK